MNSIWNKFYQIKREIIDEETLSISKQILDDILFKYNLSIQQVKFGDGFTVNVPDVGRRTLFVNFIFNKTNFYIRVLYGGYLKRGIAPRIEKNYLTYDFEINSFKDYTLEVKDFIRYSYEAIASKTYKTLAEAYLAKTAFSIQNPIQKYIDSYKEHFDRINELEIYKWVAVKCFQDHWNEEAVNFAEMLEAAFEKTKSLLDSGNYFPLRMMVKNAKVTPVKVQQLFDELYNEETDLKERIENFIAQMKQLTETNFPGKNAYQDHRAVMVYLCMRYPRRYYLYKFTMFAQFCKLIDDHYTPKKGRIENIFQFIRLCEQVKILVENDNVLQRLHINRIFEHPTAYAGNSTLLLVQDIIYAATYHFKEIESQASNPLHTSVINVEHTPVEVITQERKEWTFRGNITNHTAKQIKNKRIGDAGELFVLRQENKRLTPFKKKAEHVAISQGDGLGYDIKSYDEDGKEIYIEVKTTTQGFSTPFFVTRTELERSKVEGDRYRLYRVYDFDMDIEVGTIHISRGSLDRFCLEAESYRVGLRRIKSENDSKDKN